MHVNSDLGTIDRQSPFQMSSGTLQSYLMVYCFPIQFTIGVIGNLVNLIVLLDKRMRSSKTNVLLAAMALADILFLVFMMPHTLVYYTTLMGQPEFRVFYVYASHHIAGIINMFSFISAWMIVLVSVERMTAVLFPLKAGMFWNNKTMRIFIGCILVASIVVSSHSHITHGIKVVIYNDPVHNSTTNSTVERRVIKSMVRGGMEPLWRITTIMDTVVIVFLPIILVVVTNITIIFSLRKQKLPIPVDNGAQRSSSETHTEAPNLPTYPNPQSRNQRRATFIVFVIASTFTVCNFPSALTHICGIVRPKITSESEFGTFVTLANSLVVTSKTMNLFLFCMWSSHFRKNLCRIIRTKMGTAIMCSTKNYRSETENNWKGRPKSRYNQKMLIPTTSKRSLPTEKRDSPSCLQTRHSLPNSVDENEAESEMNGLISWNF